MDFNKDFSGYYNVPLRGCSSPTFTGPISSIEIFIFRKNKASERIFFGTDRLVFDKWLAESNIFEKIHQQSTENEYATNACL